MKQRKYTLLANLLSGKKGSVITRGSASDWNGLFIHSDNFNCSDEVLHQLLELNILEPYTPYDEYLANHKACGLKVGDKVRVIRASTGSHEDGWKNGWNQSMTNMVGRTSIIDADDGSAGFHLKSGYAYPFFVLEKVKEMVMVDGKEYSEDTLKLMIKQYTD